MGSLATPPSGDDQTRGRRLEKTNKIFAGSPEEPPSAGGIRFSGVRIRV